MAGEQKGQKNSEALDELITAMPRIAEALKGLPESVQGKAFDVLVARVPGGAPVPPPGEPDPAKKQRKETTRETKETAGEKATARRRSTGSPTLIKDLDLTPNGKKSFQDFITEKNPETQNDRSVVSVYYLDQIAGISPVTINHVFTCYRRAGWKIPAHLPNGLAVTAHEKGFFDTSNLQDIKLVSHGINRVEHDLPKKSKA